MNPISDTPKILLLGDYSNFHRTLATGLRRRGCDVTVMSDGSTFMECERDIDISRHDGKIGGLALAARLMWPLHRHMRGYDIVALRDPNFLELRPQRTGFFFRRLLRENRSVFLTALTTDVPFLDMLEAEDSPIKYSEWFIDGRPNRLYLQDKAQWEGWHLPEMISHNNLIYRNIDGAVSALYEYHMSLRRVLSPGAYAYGGIPIDLSKYPLIDPGIPKKVRLFIGRDRRRKLIKGSDIMEQACRNVVARHPDRAELVVVENVSRKIFFETMFSCHVALDQIYSYTPATTALEAMAAGLTAISGAEPEYYDFIGERHNFPIVNASPALEPLEKSIEEIVLHPEELRSRGLRSREFVEKHNHVDVVAGRFLDFWLRRICEKENKAR